MVSFKEFRRKCYPDSVWNSGAVDKRHIYRPLGLWFTKLLLPTGIHPNYLTYFMIILAICAAALFVVAQTWSYFLAIIFVFLFQILDCTDGQIARYRNICTKRGWFIDLVHEAIAFPLILFGIGLGVFYKHWNLIYLYAGSLAAIFWLMADYTRHSFERILFESGKHPDHITVTGKIKSKLFYLTYGNFNTVFMYLILLSIIFNTMHYLIIFLALSLIIRFIVQVLVLMNYIDW
jgi:phosphatidylglycerophosphate synthase